MIAILGVLLVLSHPESSSLSAITVDGDLVHLEQRLQVASLLEVIEDLDADGDRFVSQTEIEQRREQIFAYLESHYRLRTRTGGDLEAGELLVAQPISLALRAPDAAGFSLPDQVDVVLEYRASATLEELVVDSSLFRETSSAHRDFASVVWAGERAGTVVLDPSTPRWRFHPLGRGVWGDFFRMGVLHLLGTWQHLAFLAALVLATRSTRGLLGVVVALTLSQLLALSLSIAGWIDASAHARFVESALALSIAYVAADHLLAPARTRAPWIEASVFGLVHGLGMASFLEYLLVMERSRSAALAAFGLGIGAIELAAVGLVVGVVLLARRTASGERRPETRALRSVRLAGSCLLVVIGLVAFLRRAFA